jgi:hypothetical protein
MTKHIRSEEEGRRYNCINRTRRNEDEIHAKQILKQLIKVENVFRYSSKYVDSSIKNFESGTILTLKNLLAVLNLGFRHTRKLYKGQSLRKYSCR